MSRELEAALDAAKPSLDLVLDQAKTNFMAAFGSWVESAHRARLENLFKMAGRTKFKLLTAKTEAEVCELTDLYDTTVASIETLGLAVKIVGDAKAHSLIRETMNQILSVAAAVGGVMVKSFVPGPLGAVASAGIDKLVASITKSTTTA